MKTAKKTTKSLQSIDELLPVVEEKPKSEVILKHSHLTMEMEQGVYVIYDGDTDTKYRYKINHDGQELYHAHTNYMKTYRPEHQALSWKWAIEQVEDSLLKFGIYVPGGTPLPPSFSKSVDKEVKSKENQGEFNYHPIKESPKEHQLTKCSKETARIQQKKAKSTIYKKRTTNGKGISSVGDSLLGRIPSLQRQCDSFETQIKMLTKELAALKSNGSVVSTGNVSYSEEVLPGDAE